MQVKYVGSTIYGKNLKDLIIKKNKIYTVKGTTHARSGKLLYILKAENGYLHNVFQNEIR